jgi:twitching motility protein PilI
MDTSDPQSNAAMGIEFEPEDFEPWTEEPHLDSESEQRVQQRWQQIRCYGFQAGKVKVIAPLNVYCELLTDFNAEPIPNAPPHFLGLCNVRGNLVPIYQLEPLLEQPVLSARYALIIGKLEHAAGLVIANKPKQYDLRNFETTETSDELPSLLRSAVAQSYQHEGDHWHLLNHTTLFQSLAR